MATLVRFDPYRDATALQGEMARFLTLFGGGTGTATAGVWAPARDVWETDNEIVYAFDLPGIPKDTVSIEFDHGVLTVKRERSQEVSAERLYRFERRYGSFSRSISRRRGGGRSTCAGKRAERGDRAPAPIPAPNPPPTRTRRFLEACRAHGRASRSSSRFESSPPADWDG
jgi:HSP20 family protein